MVKRSKIIAIGLAIVLVIGLAGTGIVLAKGRVDSGSLSANYAVPNPDLSDKPEISDLNQMGRGGMGRGGMRGGFGVGFRDPITLTRIASFFGITLEDLRTQLRGGKSLAQIATEKGKTAREVVTVILAPWREHLQVDVRYGYLSQAEADAMYNLRAVRAEAAISRPMPVRAGAGGLPGKSGFRGMPGKGMMGGGLGPAGGTLQ